MSKKEINIHENDIRKILLAIICPLIITFIIEHFGKFSYMGYGGVSVEEYTATNLNFDTPFGGNINEDVTGKGIGYVEQSDGSLQINGTYGGKLPYYFKGLKEDIYFPLTVSLLLILYFLLSKKYKLNVETNAAKLDTQNKEKVKKKKKKKTKKANKSEFPLIKEDDSNEKI